ncbi:hypothetical protein Cantr_07548 [Candida viswanathii]|uniref:Uncharacterized protein n=1 Tax=Candida viswanathii TaxID=5486 RepID=A0A367Y2R7_9ASCO|nr:hypothetical protein Cantr_07548 [Candida viswanathii]
MPSERPFELRGLSAPEELSSPLSMGRDLRDTESSELPQAPMGGICVVNHSPIKKGQFRIVKNLNHPD